MYISEQVYKELSILDGYAFETEMKDVVKVRVAEVEKGGVDVYTQGRVRTSKLHNCLVDSYENGVYRYEIVSVIIIFALRLYTRGYMKRDDVNNLIYKELDLLYRKEQS